VFLTLLRRDSMRAGSVRGVDHEENDEELFSFGRSDSFSSPSVSGRNSMRDSTKRASEHPLTKINRMDEMTPAQKAMLTTPFDYICYGADWHTIIDYVSKPFLLNLTITGHQAVTNRCAGRERARA
jgi:hypothetical protein